MKLTIIPAAFIRINRRLANKGLEWLDSEQRQLISKVQNSSATPAEIADCHAMLSEDLPNRCGIETADLYTLTEDALAARPSPRSELSFDGFGINGPDEYRTRFCTFSRNSEHEALRKKYGPMFEAAPELLAALCVMTLDPLFRFLMRERDPKAFEQAEAAIAKAKGETP